jgi:AbrB family looped-hinge helix DNA binding protein
MIDMIITPMERGQITLPKVYREKLGITSGTPLNISLEDERIVITPLEKMIKNISGGIIKPRIGKSAYLSKIAEIAGKKTTFWKKQDDSAKEEMEDKEKFY